MPLTAVVRLSVTPSVGPPTLSHTSMGRGGYLRVAAARMRHPAPDGERDRRENQIKRFRVETG